MNHRDTMNTEKNKNLVADIGSLIDAFSDSCPASFFSVFIVSLWSTLCFPLQRHG